MGNSGSSYHPGQVSGMEEVIKNHMVLTEMVQYLEVSDLLNLRQVNVGCDHFLRARLARVGVPAKGMTSDQDIEEFTNDMANGPRPLPFSSFQLDLTRISMEGVNQFLQHQDAILELSIVHVPENNGMRETYVQHLVGPKLGRILTTLARTLRTLRLKTFGDLVGGAEPGHFPLQLEALTTLEVVYSEPNPDFEGDLAHVLAQRAGNLEHIIVRQRDTSVNFVQNLIESVPNFLYGRARQALPSLSLDTNVRVQDFRIFDHLFEMGYNRVRRLNLGLFSYHLCQQVAPAMYGNLLRSLTNLLSLQGDTLEDLLLVTSHVEGVQQTGSNEQIQLPGVMTQLGRLALYFPRKEDTVPSPVAPFQNGQFPKLTQVDLGYDHGWFRDLVVPTVTSFQVNFGEEVSRHDVIFPGLKALLFYAQDPPKALPRIMARGGGGVEVLGCFGLGNRITSPQQRTALVQRAKNVVGDVRIPEEHLLGHFYGMTRFDLSQLHKSLTMWQRGLVFFGPTANPIQNWPQLGQFHLSIFTEEESKEVELLYGNGHIPMFKEFGVWLFPNHETRRDLSAANLGPYNEVTFVVTVEIQ